MAWTASTFKVRFAAFAPKSDALIEASSASGAELGRYRAQRDAEVAS